MKYFLMNIWQDEAGAETAEWLIIVAMITAVAAGLYTGVLADALTGTVTYIEGVIGGVGTAAG
jgi:Flp pilus assembly pilin Flp